MRFLKSMWVLAAAALVAAACGVEAPRPRFTGAAGEVKLVTLEPAHFHAALVQKYDNPQIDPVVHVYAPRGPELDAHLALVDGFNTRATNPAHWSVLQYNEADYADRLFTNPPGNVLVVAGDNGRKIGYIQRAVATGMHVLADKPMVINPDGFTTLQGVLAKADSSGLVVNDVMTERHEITSILQRELSMVPALFGTLERGTPENPAITKESVHFFYKTVNGKPLVRPTQFYDVTWEGEGIVDVSTHLVDLIMWQGFPGQGIDYRNAADSVRVLRASVSSVPITEAQFRRSTNSGFTERLAPFIQNGVLQVPAIGDFSFAVRGVHAKVSVKWQYENPKGGDTHYSVMRGTKANLVIQTNEPQRYIPTLYVRPAAGRAKAEFKAALDSALAGLSARYPGLTAKETSLGWEIGIPGAREGHEDHFMRVTESYLQALVDGKLQAWERTNLETKYFITTEAYRLSR